MVRKGSERTLEFPGFFVTQHLADNQESPPGEPLCGLKTFWEILLSKHSLSQNKYYFHLYGFLKRRIHALVGKLEQSFINFGKPFFRISRIWNIAQTWFLARLFVYLSSFISQIPDVLYWMVCIFIFHCVTVQTENNHKQDSLAM